MDEQGSVQSGNPGEVGQAQGQQGQWYDAFPEDVRGLVQNKGWQSPVDAIQSYTNLEKFLGADKAGRGLVLPKDDAGADEWGQVYDRLGRPADPLITSCPCLKAQMVHLLRTLPRHSMSWG